MSLYDMYDDNKLIEKIKKLKPKELTKFFPQMELLPESVLQEIFDKRFNIAISIIMEELLSAGEQKYPKIFKILNKRLTPSNRTTFNIELKNLINKHSVENKSNTPDFILAEYIRNCLENFEKTIINRDKWYGFKPNTNLSTKKESSK